MDVVISRSTRTIRIKDGLEDVEDHLMTLNLINRNSYFAKIAFDNVEASSYHWNIIGKWLIKNPSIKVLEIMTSHINNSGGIEAVLTKDNPYSRYRHLIKYLSIHENSIDTLHLSHTLVFTGDAYMRSFCYNKLSVFSMQYCVYVDEGFQTFLDGFFMLKRFVFMSNRSRPPPRHITFDNLLYNNRNTLAVFMIWTARNIHPTYSCSIDLIQECYKLNRFECQSYIQSALTMTTFEYPKSLSNLTTLNININEDSVFEMYKVFVGEIITHASQLESLTVAVENPEEVEKEDDITLWLQLLRTNKTITKFSYQCTCTYSKDDDVLLDLIRDNTTLETLKLGETNKDIELTLSILRELENNYILKTFTMYFHGPNIPLERAEEIFLKNTTLMYVAIADHLYLFGVSELRGLYFLQAMDQKDILDRRVVHYMLQKYQVENPNDLLSRLGEVDYFVLLPFKTCYVSYKRKDAATPTRCSIRAFAMHNLNRIFVHVPDLINMIFPTFRAYEYETLLDNSKRCQDISSLDLTELWNPSDFRTIYPYSTPVEYIHFNNTVNMFTVIGILQQQLSRYERK